MLRNLSAKKKALHYQKHLGQTRKVLFENGPDEKYMSGFTDNYIRIIAEHNSAMVNSIQDVELVSMTSFKNEAFVNAELTQVSW